MFGVPGEETLDVMDSLLDSRIRFITTGHFSDRVLSGRRKSLRAATAYRDHLIAHYPPLSRQAQCSIRKKNNPSGVSGLVRVDVWETRRGAAYVVFTGMPSGQRASARRSRRSSR